MTNTPHLLHPPYHLHELPDNPTPALRELIEVHATLTGIISPVFIVGGALRDALLGEQNPDIDAATPLIPSAVLERCKTHDIPVLNVAEQFGTITCVFDKQTVEITSFRTERYERRSRYPRVSFGASLAADLARRDFTINALALNDQRIVDKFGGLDDLKRKVIRMVGNASERLDQDPLRILRAARFASKLGFILDDELFTAMTKAAGALDAISSARLKRELSALLALPDPQTALHILAQTGHLDSIAQVLIELLNSHNKAAHTYSDLAYFMK